MLGSVVLLFSLIIFGICLGIGDGWQSSHGKQIPPKLPYICTLPPEAGPCEPLIAIPRYAYNATSGRCELFSYGGCEGNPNNFKTIKQCKQCCPAITSMSCPKVNITVCESPVNSLTGKCLGGGQFTTCGSACPPLICGQQTTRVVCLDVCMVGCFCPYFRRISDCQCVKKECCNVGSNKRSASGQTTLCPPKYP